MAKTFSINTTATEIQKADPSGRADIKFEVTNTSGQSARGLAKPKALGDTKQEWLKLQGEAERDFPPGEPQTFNVTFDGPVVPASAAPKAATAQATTASAAPKGATAQATATAEVGPIYSFRLDVAATKNPDEDFTEGPPVKVEAAVGQPKKKFPIWIIPVAAVVLIGIGVGIYFAMRDTKVDVPNVVGMQLADAKAAIEGDGLKPVEGATQITGNAPAGQVIEQSPAAGEKLDKDAEVVLTVEGEEALVEVPDVVKRLVNDATQRLTDAGFTVVTTGTEVVEGLQPNQVVSQKPGSGEKAAPGAPVELVVAAEKLVEVPDVRFNPVALAKQKLTAAGLKPEEQAPELADASVPAGSVKSHNPAAGAKVPPSSVIALVVAAPSTQVPSIVGKKVAEAQFLLQQKQLEMVVHGTFNQTNAATVQITSQTPAAGATVATGSKVTAHVPCIVLGLRRRCEFIFFERPLAADRINTTTVQPVDRLRVRKAVPLQP